MSVWCVCWNKESLGTLFFIGMLALRGALRAFAWTGRSRSFLPMAAVASRGFSKVVENNVIGKDRLEKLGKLASYRLDLCLRGRYPHFHVTHSLSDFRSKWDYLKNGERDETSEVYVAGVFFENFLNSRKNY